MIERIGQHKVQTVAGELDLIAYRDKTVGQPHLALVVGKPQPDREAWVRVHEPRSPLDLLGVASRHAWPLDPALQAIQSHGNGVLLMLNCAPDAETVTDQIEQWANPEPGAGRAGSANDSRTLRSYGIGAQILRDLGVGRMKLLTRERRMPSMAGFNLEVTGYLEADADGRPAGSN